MRFHFHLLAASYSAALTAAFPPGNLFDASASSSEIPPSYNDDTYLFDPSQVETAAELPADDSSLALECTSSGPDELISKTKARRNEGGCPSPISAGDAEDFNWERKIRQTIESTQSAAQANGRTLQFCPPLTQPLCCIGTPEYLGVEVLDCEPCKLVP
jgi:hypothetical protein